jgi:hypothetical protein
MAHHSFTDFRRREILGVLGAGALGAALPWPARAQTPPVAALKFATIGAGREGSALGKLFAAAGHQVMFSSRHPDELKFLVESIGPSAKAGTVADAVAFGDVVAVVVPYGAIEQIGKDYAAALAQKALVFDVSNPIARRDGDDLVKWVDEQGGAGLATAKLLPGAKLVRAFNAIGSGSLADDAHKPDKIGIPIAGDDQGAIQLASALILEVGFEPVLIGGLAMGKYLVPGTPLAREHSPAEIKQIAATLKP